MDGEPLEPLEAAPHHRMVERVAAEMKRYQRIDPRRLDPSPGSVGLLAIDDPALGAGERRLSDRPQRMALVQVEEAVEREQQAAAQRICTGRRPGLRPAELADLERQRPDRPDRQHHRQRDDGLTGPAGEVIRVQRHPGGEQHHLRRQHRHLLPRPRPEQREPNVGEHPGPLEPALSPDPGGRGAHVIRGGLIAG